MQKKQIAPSVFDPYTLSNVRLKNRLAVAPMTRVSSDDEGRATAVMADYYENYAAGGFGLIITEGLYTDKEYSQGYRFQPGLTSLLQCSSWREVNRRVHRKGAAIVAQLMHAGALSQFNKYRAETAAPSAVKPDGEQMAIYYGQGGYAKPKAMTEQDIENVISGFINAAIYAKEAGFDGVEIHGANGYLLDQFLTDYTNDREDVYGGDIAGRIAIFKRIVDGIKEVSSPGFIVGVRFSQAKINDIEYRWPMGLADAEVIFATMAQAGVSYIHTTEHCAERAAFVAASEVAESGVKSSDSLALLAKKISGLPVIANGGIRTKDQADSVLESEQSDIVALGKVALANPDWPQKVCFDKPQEMFSYDMFNPIADIVTGDKFYNRLS